MKAHTRARTQLFQCLSRLEDIVVSGVVEVVFRRTFERKIEGDVEYYYYIVHLLLMLLFFTFCFYLRHFNKKISCILIIIVIIKILSPRTLPAFFTFTIFIFMTFGIGEFIGARIFCSMVWCESFHFISFHLFPFPCLLFIRL